MIVGNFSYLTWSREVNPMVTVSSPGINISAGTVTRTLIGKYIRSKIS